MDKSSWRKKEKLAQRPSGMFVKVPEITMYFWIIKVLATTVGETFADFLNTNLGLGLSGTSIATLIGLAVVLFFQFKGKGYNPPIYWLAIVLISIAGTLVTDNMTDNLGVSLITSSIAFSICLTAVFTIWYVEEKNLTMHSIYTPTRAAFYWLTILFTFALGTATGDLLAERFALGYGYSLLVFATFIALISVLW